MAIAIMRVKRFESKKVFRVVSSNSSHHKKSGQSCFLHSIRENLKQITSIVERQNDCEEILEKIMELIEEQICKTEDMMATILRSLRSSEKKRDSNLWFLESKNKESIFRTKFLYAKKSILSFLLGVKDVMAGRGELPPNNLILCRN